MGNFQNQRTIVKFKCNSKYQKFLQKGKWVTNIDVIAIVYDVNVIKFKS